MDFVVVVVVLLLLLLLLFLGGSRSLSHPRNWYGWECGIGSGEKYLKKSVKSLGLNTVKILGLNNIQLQ